jgi:hypothetical protein
MHARLSWRFGLVVAFATVILSLYPQFNLWYLTGKEWNGIYAYNDIDEVAYAAYLKALMDGRPRRNDPYTGRDDGQAAPQHESLFSIQFLPPYVVAKVSRALGLSVSWAMIALGAFAGFLTALILFWLIAAVTNDERLAAVGTLAIICLGTLACAQGAVSGLFRHGDIAYPYLPFLRRYVPAFPFPFFFLMCGLVWKTLTNEDARRKVKTAIGAGLVFATLVYSYFYIWTTAAAWLFCLALTLSLARADGWRRDLKYLGLVGLLAAAALGPYALLLSRRSETIDNVQLLAFSRAPDLARAPELICLAVLAALMIAVKRGRIRLRERATLFTISLALTPYAVLNQQVVTGRSLQPIHYEVFIANYVSVLAVVLCVSLIRRGAREGKALFPGWALACAAALIFGWGLVEAKLTTEVLDPHNEYRNRVTPVLQRLAELGGETGDGRRVTEQLVFSSDTIISDEVPTLAPQPVLWARHQHIFVGANAEESKERFYQWMYYTGYDAEWLEEALRQQNFTVVYALFGWGRLSNRLVINPQPLTREETAREVQAYGDYIASFNRERAARLPLSYLIMPASDEEVPEEIDRWYEHDRGERLGDHMLYRLKLKP